MSEEEYQEVPSDDNIFYLGTLYILDEPETEDSALPKICDFTRVYLNDNSLSKKGLRSQRHEEFLDEKSLLCNRSLASLEVLAPGSSLSSNNSNVDLSPIEDDIPDTSFIPENENNSALHTAAGTDATPILQETGDNVIINLADLKVSDVSTLNRKIHNQEVVDDSDIALNMAARSVAFVLKNFHLPEPECKNVGSESSVQEVGEEIDSSVSSDSEVISENDHPISPFEEEDEDAAAMRALGLPTAFGKDSQLFDPAAQHKSDTRKRAKRKKSKSKSVLQREISSVQHHSHVVEKIFNDLWQNWTGSWQIQDQNNFYKILKEKLQQFLDRRSEKQKEKDLEALQSKDDKKLHLKMDIPSDCNRFFGMMGFVSDFVSTDYVSPNSACYQVFPKTLSATKNLGLCLLPLQQTEENNPMIMDLKEVDSHETPQTHETSESSARKREIDAFICDEESTKRLHVSDRDEGTESGHFDPRLDDEVSKYWPQRYRFFDLFDEGIQLDKESWFSVTPQIIAEHHASRCRCDVIIDAFCGAGGNTIRFAQTCQLVIAIDIDPVKLSMARHNAQIYGVEHRCVFIQGDFFTLVKQLRVRADIVFLSPPWGGPDYLNHTAFNQPKLQEILDAAFSITSDVVYHGPRNLNVAQLVGATRFGQRCQIEQNIVNYKLKVITVYWGGLITQQPDSSIPSAPIDGEHNEDIIQKEVEL